MSNLIVRLLSDYTGSGPIKARTHFNDNLVTVVVQDLLTKGERSPIRDGKEDRFMLTPRRWTATTRRRHTRLKTPGAGTICQM